MIGIKVFIVVKMEENKDKIEEEKYCECCVHKKICYFKIKMSTFLNNHSHLFSTGSYTITGRMALICRHFINSEKEVITFKEIERYNPLTSLTLKEVEDEYILKILELFNNNRSKTAILLNIGERTLYRRIKDIERIGANKDKEEDIEELKEVLNKIKIK